MTHHEWYMFAPISCFLDFILILAKNNKKNKMSDGFIEVFATFAE